MIDYGADRHRRRALSTPACASASRWRKDMIAVRIGPDMRLAVVGAPSYFARRPRAEDAAGPDRATPASTCACRPMAGSTPGSSRKDGRELRVRVEGQLVFNGVCSGARRGARRGSAWPICRRITLRRTSPTGGSSGCSPTGAPPCSGYHLYYPSRRQSSPAFALLVDALRYRDAPQNELKT